MFDSVKFQALRRPVQSLDPIVNMPGVCNMADDIYILKITRVYPVNLPQRKKRVVIQNGAVCLELSLTGILIKGPAPFQLKPQHISTSAELHSILAGGVLQADIKPRPCHPKNTA